MISPPVMSEFQDHFSSLAATYARHRPRYPRALFEHLVALAPGRELCWDCATGQGQAALSLAEWFERVVATDASAEQLAEAPAHPRVEFRRALAEESALADASVDLITVATALHWFDFDRFYAEVRRVAKPGAVLAAWAYGSRVEIEPPIDLALERFARESMGPWWPERFHHQWTRYRDLPFPFPRLPAPELAAETFSSLDDLIGMVRSWSCVPRCAAATGRDPALELEAELLPLWGDRNLERRAVWPLHFAIGRIE
jgi:ubiquinone/menaquinone biosynthesis C-methylase UbiE